MKVRDFLPQNITQNQFYIYIMTFRQYWLDTANAQNVFKLTTNASTKLI